MVYQMRFLGIDFGWSTGPSGLAALEWDGAQLTLLEMVCHQPFDDILAWVDRVAGNGPALVAVDAPTIIPNETGMRLPDKLTHRYFGKYHAGCYPANVQRPFAERTMALGKALEARKFKHADAIEPLLPGRYQIECFPHPAMVHLFDLSRILKYKKGRLAERRLELEYYRKLILKELPLLTPRLSLSSLPSIPEKGIEMKALEDQLDGLICAYIGAYWWYWGVARNQVLGNREEGYIVVPHRLVTKRFFRSQL
jgi:predicted RNase H-like nuclease